MKLENVFYGFTKDGSRKLLWKKNKIEITSYGDVSRTMYYDLEEKEYIDPIEIDERSLEHIFKLVGYSKRKSRRKVIDAYQADCNITYDVAGAFYGNIVTKTTKYDLKTANGFFIGSASDDLYEEVLIPEVENLLFARIDDAHGRVKCVYTGSLFPFAERIKKGISVEEVRPVNKSLFSESVISKKKLLEADYRKKL